MTIRISAIDHIVLTVADIQRTIDFYTRVIGMTEETFGDGRKALTFGGQKFNLHQQGREFEPKAQAPTPGSIDICLICETPVEQAAAYLERQDVDIIEGPVRRTGARGNIVSIYFRDPDDNLVELCNYPATVASSEAEVY